MLVGGRAEDAVQSKTYLDVGPIWMLLLRIFFVKGWLIQLSLLKAEL